MRREIVIIIFTLLGVASLALGARSGRSKQEVLQVKYSQRLIRPAGMDAQGNLTFSSYSGPSLTIYGIISEVSLKNRSPSIAEETDVVWFKAEPSSGVRPFDAIKLLFDKEALFEVDKFVRGDRWLVLVTPEYKLISLKKVPRAEPKEM